MLPAIAQLWREFLDVLYPPECALCASGDLTQQFSGQCEGICRECWPYFEGIAFPYCDTCGDPIFTPAAPGTVIYCSDCMTFRPAFLMARSGYRARGPVRELIHRFKYLRQLDLSSLLGELLSHPLRRLPELREARVDQWPVVPVPLHWAKQRKRQFNQTAELAAALAKRSPRPVWPCLRRVVKTRVQARLTRQQRLANVRRAFAVKPGWIKRLRGSKVLLLDDVFTTGATVHACARALKKAGAAEVIVLTLARA